MAEVTRPPGRAVDGRAARSLAGALLLAAGVWLLARQLLDVGMATLALAIGVVLVVGWVRSRRPILLLIGAPLSGSALGLLAGGLVAPAGRVTALLVGIAVGYGAAAVAHRWAVVPAIATAALALASSGLDLARVLPASAAGVVLAAAAIGLGVALIAGPRVPRAVAVGSTAVLLVATTSAVAVLAQAAVTGVVGDGASAAVRTTQQLNLPALEGRTLVVVAATATTVLLDGPLGGQATVEASGGQPRTVPTVIEVVERDDRVEVREIAPPGATVSLTLHIPFGTRASVLGGTGSVLADLRGHAVEIDTTSGAVTVDGRPSELAIRTVSGPAAVSVQVGQGDDVVVRTDSGDIDLHVTGSPSITAEAAAIFVDGYGAPQTDLRRFTTSGAGGSLTVATTSGTVAIVRAANRRSVLVSSGPTTAGHPQRARTGHCAQQP